jgi:hypothetical protein
MKYFLTVLNICLALILNGQCLNDICDNVITLDPCFPEPLSEGCTGNQPSGLQYVASNICNDQWFNVVIPDTISVTITLSSEGYTQGIRFITYYGDSCDNLEFVFVSGSAISAGIECNEGPPTDPSILQSQWLPQNVGVLPDENAFCPHSEVHDVQQTEIVLTLIPGTYWFRVFPRTSNCITGTGTITICFNNFLNFPELPENTQTNTPELKAVFYDKRLIKVYRDGYGVLLYDIVSKKYYTISYQQIYIYD